MKTRMQLGTTTAMALSLALTGAAVMAQEATDSLYLGQIIYGYTTDGTPIYAAENVTSLDGQAFRQAGGTAKLDDAVRQQASTFTRVNPGQAGVAVNIRGFEGSGRVAMSVDGVPQNFRFTGHEASGYAYFDQNLLAGVDVTRGAGTTAGNSGLAGSINFRTLSASDVVDGTGAGGLVRLGYGVNGENFTQTVATGLVTENFELLGAMSTREGNNYTNGDGDIVANSWQDTQSGMLKGAYHIAPGQTIDFSAMHYVADFAANSYNQTVTSDTFSLGATYDAGDGLINLTSNIYLAETEMEYTSAITPSPFATSTGRVLNNRSYGGDVTNISELTFGAWQLTSTNGFEFNRDDVTGTTAGVNPSDAETERLAIFSENVFTNGAFQVTAGLRYNNYSATNNVSGAPLNIEHDSLDPKVSLGYQVVDGVTPYVSWSQTSRAPTLQEALLGGGHPGAVSMTMYANPDLEPEVATGYEVGVTFDRQGLLRDGDSLSGRVAYYQLDVENYITAAGGQVNPFNPSQTGVAYVNVPGTSQTSGVEVEANYRSDLFSFGLAYSTSDSELPSMFPGAGAGNYLPDEKVTATLAGHFLDQALTVGVTYNYVSGGLVSTYNSTFDGGATVESNDDYELWDAFVNYDVSENFSVNVKGTNLFDTQYTPWLATTGTGQGQNIYIGAEFRF